MAINVDSAVGHIRSGHVVLIVSIAVLIGLITNLTAHLLVSIVEEQALKRRASPVTRYMVQAALLTVEIVLLIIILRTTVW